MAVEENARVYGSAWVSGSARVYGSAQVYGSARVSGSAKIDGSKKWPIMHGYESFSWTAYREKDGTPILNYGCEHMKLAEWTEDMQRAKCVEHAWKDVANELAALVVMLRSRFALTAKKRARSKVAK